VLPDQTLAATCRMKSHGHTGSDAGRASCWTANRFRIDASDPAHGGIDRTGIVSPKGGAVVRSVARHRGVRQSPGFQQQMMARAATSNAPTINCATADRATPLVRAKGAEVGVRTRPPPGILQSSVTLWSLNLDSELVLSATPGRRKRVARAIATVSNGRTTQARDPG